MRLVPADQPRVTTAAAAVAVAAAESKLAFPKRTRLTGSRTGGGGGAGLTDGRGGQKMAGCLMAPPLPTQRSQRIGCQISGRFRGVTEQRRP